MSVLGLDISTKTGVVILSDDGDVLYADESTVKNQTGMERASTIVGKILKAIEKYNPDFAILEGYGYANAYTLATLVEIGTVIRYFLWQMDFPYYEVAPTQLKKFMGKGTMKKDMIRLECYKQFGFQHQSDNVIDAYVLAKIGLAAIGKHQITKIQYETLKASKSLSESPIWMPVKK